MLFFNLLYFVCLSLSVSYMYSFSEIFRTIRNIIARIPYIRRPFLCPECTSFWFGLLVSYLYNPIYLNINVPLLTNIFCGLITHIFAAFLYKRKVENSSINFIN
jgi:hypothetical protein